MKLTVIAAILIVAPASLLRADAQLKPLDLEAAYCAAATAQLRDSESPQSPVAKDLDRGAQHFEAYLASRGFASRANIPMLATADAQGRSDGKDAFRIAQSCIPQCPDVTLDQKQQLMACMSACEQKLDVNKITPRLASCTAAERQLP